MALAVNFESAEAVDRVLRARSGCWRQPGETAQEGVLGRLFRQFPRSRRSPLGSRAQSLLASSTRPGGSISADPETSAPMSRPYAKLPGWIDYGLIPLINLVVAFAVAGLVVLAVGESPLEAAALMLRGAFGYRRGRRLHPLLRHQLHLHRPRRRGRLPWRPLQHRRRGAGLCRRARRRRRGAVARRGPALVAEPAAGGRPVLRLRRALGADPRLSPGEARQPHRHHHHHVQLHRRRADGLSPRRRAEAGGHDGAGDRAPSSTAASCRSCGGLFALFGSNLGGAPLNVSIFVALARRRPASGC